MKNYRKKKKKNYLLNFLNLRETNDYWKLIFRCSYIALQNQKIEQ